jgi:hypothetical protein
MLKAWRNHRQFFVECDVCASRGTTHVQARTEIEPGVALKRSAHIEKAKVLGQSYQATINAIVDQAQKKQITLDDAQKQIAAEFSKHYASLVLLAKDAPGDETGIAHYLDACPWCGVKPAQPALIWLLPPDVHEPADWRKGA